MQNTADKEQMCVSKKKTHTTYKRPGVRTGVRLVISTLEDSEASPLRLSGNAVSNWNSITSQTVNGEYKYTQTLDLRCARFTTNALFLRKLLELMLYQNKM